LCGCFFFGGGDFDQVVGSKRPFDHGELFFAGRTDGRTDERTDGQHIFKLGLYTCLPGPPKDSGRGPNPMKGMTKNDLYLALSNSLDFIIKKVLPNIVSTLCFMLLLCLCRLYGKDVEPNSVYHKLGSAVNSQLQDAVLQGFCQNTVLGGGKQL
jgi:hypothetical protein